MAKPRYIPLTQQPFCCVPTCIQMILLRRKLQMLSQEEIGYELGLSVPKEYSKILPMARTGRKPSAGWGTQLDRKEYSINSFFKKKKIKLREEYFPLSRIKDTKSFIREQIAKNHDIIACFNNSKLYGGVGEGHVSIIDGIQGNYIMLIDPAKDAPKFRKVRLSHLLEAISIHGEKNRAGFWTIRSNQTTSS